MTTDTVDTSDRSQRTYVQFVRTPRRRNPVSTAYRAQERGELVFVQIAASFCHSNDRFNRHLGRKIAEGRLSSHPANFAYVRNVTQNFNAELATEVRKYVEGLGYSAPAVLTAGSPVGLDRHDMRNAPSDQDVHTGLSHPDYIWR